MFKCLLCHSSVKLSLSCRCRKLPRALKEWQAFEELRKTIDDFNEMVPLLELMANKAMKPRHWKRMTDITGHLFDIENENFTLKNILQAPLIQFKEEIEVSGDLMSVIRLYVTVLAIELLFANLLSPSGTIWHLGNWSTLVQVPAHFLVAPSHYLNQH